MTKQQHYAHLASRDGEIAFKMLALLLTESGVARPMVIGMIEELGRKLKDVTEDECEEFIHALRMHASAHEIPLL